jgi:hypothetical protein
MAGAGVSINRFWVRSGRGKGSVSRGRVVRVGRETGWGVARTRARVVGFVGEASDTRASAAAGWVASLLGRGGACWGMGVGVSDQAGTRLWTGI